MGVELLWKLELTWSSQHCAATMIELQAFLGCILPNVIVVRSMLKPQTLLAADFLWALLVGKLLQRKHAQRSKA